ncbi:MAG: dTMP kinase [Actinomycetota bacterium]
MSQQGQGYFCVLEGLDGVGTTTIAGLLKERLMASDLRVRLTAEPTEGAFGRLLRRHLSKEVHLAPSTAALVFTADRADHLTSVIRPALARGRIVISDRYLLSTLAYQGAGGVAMEAVLAASEGFDVPDVTFLLELPEEVRRARMSGRDGLERYEEPEFDAKLRASYAQATALLRSRGHRIESIDASKSPDDIVTELIVRLDAGS